VATCKNSGHEPLVPGKERECEVELKSESAVQRGFVGSAGLVARRRSSEAQPKGEIGGNQKATLWLKMGWDKVGGPRTWKGPEGRKDQRGLLPGGLTD